jgi:hypothetical protein
MVQIQHLVKIHVYKIIQIIKYYLKYCILKYTVKKSQFHS